MYVCKFITVHPCTQNGVRAAGKKRKEKLQWPGVGEKKLISRCQVRICSEAMPEVEDIVVQEAETLHLTYVTYIIYIYFFLLGM